MLGHINGTEGTGLQFGCANGYETKRLSSALSQLDVVDGSTIFIERLKANDSGSNINYHCALFEDFDHGTVGRTYDFLSCNYIMEHVYDTSSILANIKSMMHDKSLLFITVPNSLALSRRLALEMGLVSSLSALTENDHKHGHRRTYTADSLRSEVKEAGFKVVKEQGIVMKILADFQLNGLLKSNVLKKEHIIGLQGLAEKGENVTYSDSIFLVLQKGGN